MTSQFIIAILGIILVPLFVLYLALDKNATQRNIWLFPALLSVAFSILTVFAVINVGPLGFWTLHTADLWGNQVWLDLLFAVSIALFFALPQARAVGMKPLPWVIFTICTGCIGLLAMTSRILYLRGRSEQTLTFTPATSGAK